jgi:predicted dehydrogenase
MRISKRIVFPWSGFINLDKQYEIMGNLSRSEFLRRMGALGTAALLQPVAAGSMENKGTVEKRIRVGVIGCGSVSNMYLPHLSKSPHVELVSLCDIRPERAEEQGKKFGVANRYPHIDKMLSGVPFDLFVNLTNMQEHGRLNRQALMAGKHVWSEKPMADTYAEGRALLDLAGKRGLRIWGAPAVVNSPQFAFMARTIRGGGLGRVAAAHAHYGHTGPSWSAFFFMKRGAEVFPTWGSTTSPPSPDFSARPGL